VLVVCFSLSGCTGPSADESNADADPPIWVITGGWFDHLRFEDEALTRRMFLRPPSLIIGTYHLRSAPIGGQTPRGVSTAFAYASYRNLRDIAHSPSFLRDLDALMYDPEAWDATPIEEQRDLERFFARFASLSRRYVGTVIITPHPNLVTVPHARCSIEGTETVYEAFIRCGVMEMAARSADVVEVQAQQLQSRPDEYRAFVVQATAQARSAHEGVKVIAGLTTAHASPSQMFEAWQAARDVVDGYYLSIRDDREVATALDFLRLLPRKVVA
jgi:hypothetical protein